MFFSTEIGQGTEEMKIAEHTCINQPQRDKHRLTLATGSGCFFFLSRMPACVLIEHFLVRLPWQSAPFLVLVVTQRGEHCAALWSQSLHRITMGGEKEKQPETAMASAASNQAILISSLNLV